MSLSVDSRYLQSRISNPFQAGLRGQLPGYAQLASLQTSPYSLPQFPVPPVSPTSDEKPAKPTSTIEALDALAFGIFSGINGSSGNMSVVEKGANSSWKLWKRRMVSESGQAAVDYMAANGKTLQNVEDRAAQLLGVDKNKLKGLSQNFSTYSMAAMFGIGSNKIAFSRLLEKGATPLGQEWRCAVRQNFANMRLMPKLADGSAIRMSKFLKYNLGDEFLGKIIKFISTGEGAFKASIASLVLGFTAMKTYNTMQEAYRRSDAKGDGLLTRLFKTAVAGVKELSYYSIGCLAGNLAYTVAAGAIAVGGLSVAGGLAAAAFGGVATSALLKSVFGKPISDADPDEKTAKTV